MVGNERLVIFIEFFTANEETEISHREYKILKYFCVSLIKDLQGLYYITVPVVIIIPILPGCDYQTVYEASPVGSPQLHLSEVGFVLFDFPVNVFRCLTGYHVFELLSLFCHSLDLLLVLFIFFAAFAFLELENLLLQITRSLERFITLRFST